MATIKNLNISITSMSEQEMYNLIKERRHERRHPIKSSGKKSKEKKSSGKGSKLSLDQMFSLLTKEQQIKLLEDLDMN